MFCSNCGAKAPDGVSNCLACGAPLACTAPRQPLEPQPPYQAYSSYQQPLIPGRGMGIASMVLGIVDLVLLFVWFVSWFISIPCGILGLVLGIMAAKRASDAGMHNSMATAGIICCAIGTALCLFFILITVFELNILEMRFH